MKQTISDFIQRTEVENVSILFWFPNEDVIAYDDEDDWKKWLKIEIIPVSQEVVSLNGVFLRLARLKDEPWKTNSLQLMSLKANERLYYRISQSLGNIPVTIDLCDIERKVKELFEEFWEEIVNDVLDGRRAAQNRQLQEYVIRHYSAPWGQL